MSRCSWIDGSVRLYRHILAARADMSFVFIFLAVTILALYCIASSRKPANYPPGPRWLPIVGCSRAVASACERCGYQHKAFAELALKYSSKVLGLKLGSELVVVVFGEKLVKHVLTSEHFHGRPRNYFMKLRCLGKQIGITGTDGNLWREHRLFTVKHLKHIGFGKQLMEEQILKELTHIVDEIKLQVKGVNLRNILAPAIMNVLWMFVAGQSIRDDKRLLKLLNLLSIRSKAFSMSGGWLNEHPWIRFIAPQSSGYSLICKINREITKIISDAIIKHDMGVVTEEDFMYAFMEEMKAGKETYTKEQLLTVCLDLLIAGSQTTTNLLEFAFLMSLRNQDIQEILFEEISRAIGSNYPSWPDHTRLPHTMSFLLEVQRYFTVVPIIGPRRALKDCLIDGYFIPKNTTILLSIYDLHHDVISWKDPEKFIPERFIGEGGELKDTERLLTFGLGKRRCPGDALAKRFIFLIFVGVLQKYKIECSNGVIPSCDPIGGLVMSPSVYTADFRERL